MSITDTFKQVKKASKNLSHIKAERIDDVLRQIASYTLDNIDIILTENAKDLALMDKANPKYDRLLLTEKRLQDICNDLVKVSKLSTPLYKTLEDRTLDNGLHLQKITVPLGVVGIVYEARPNVTFDCTALCLKSGNAALLKGGSDATYSNAAIASLIHHVLKKNDLDMNMVTLLPGSREATEAMLQAHGYIDVIIPRGSQSLIDYVREHSKIPVIETGAGIVHTYFDESADLQKGKAIVNNEKTRRVSVCNALDCLIVHQSRLPDLYELVEPLIESHVTIYADEHSYSTLHGKYPDQLLQPTDEHSYGTEFLDYKMSIKTVNNIQEAIEHIDTYSSMHSECIISQNKDNIQLFLQSVDAAAVYANASTAFTDGAQFGMGAEIGISTQKLHARGPMALSELTSYKWIVHGTGQVRG
ncbi:MAG: glutamate-5-semialdehyde dehydrogenase [Cytophagales bacterium]|nr:glutamate-5-semialdehyde dehydrogenase [Cytophagales bacterium]